MSLKYQINKTLLSNYFCKIYLFLLISTDPKYPNFGCIVSMNDVFPYLKITPRFTQSRASGLIKTDPECVRRTEPLRQGIEQLLVSHQKPYGPFHVDNGCSQQKNLDNLNQCWMSILASFLLTAQGLHLRQLLRASRFHWT